MKFNIFQIYYDLAVNTYHIDPFIFTFLMVFSVPFYYYGWFKIGKEILIFKKKYSDKRNHLKVSDILTEKGFAGAVGLNRFAWILPYLYVIFWGRNIPWWFWILFFSWIIFMGYMFWLKVKKLLTRD